MTHPSQKENMFRKYGIVTLLIFELVVLVVLGFLAGAYLDKKLHLEGIGGAVGAILGFMIGFYKFYTDTKKFLS